MTNLDLATTMAEEKDGDNADFQASADLGGGDVSATPIKAPEAHVKFASPSKTGTNSAAMLTARAKRRREEAVRRLVTDIQARSEKKYGGADTAGVHTESQDWIVASTVAAALERSLDRDLHQELVSQAKENSGRIGQVCHDHSDVFLASVGKVVALGGPAADLANKLLQAQDELEVKTAGPMRESAVLWEEAKQSHARAQALYVLVNACQRVSKWLERARKQAALGRPRAALEAVDEARTALTSPLTSLFFGSPMEHAAPLLKMVTAMNREEAGSKHETSSSSNKNILSLEETPFGRRSLAALPKIENEVLMGARRGLNRWFLAMRSGGDGAKAGRAVLRKSAHSIAVGPGGLGLGGHVPPSYLWRAKVSDNLIARMSQNGRVVRAVRLGYWFERDAPKEANRLESSAPGMERRAEAFASAFGWYRCWEEGSTLMLDPADYTAPEGARGGLSGSSHGLRGSRHGLGGSRHGKGSSLGFRAKRSQGTGIELSSATKNQDEKSRWAPVLTPAILFDNTPTR